MNLISEIDYVIIEDTPHFIFPYLGIIFQLYIIYKIFNFTIWKGFRMFVSSADNERKENTLFVQHFYQDSPKKDKQIGNPKGDN